MAGVSWSRLFHAVGVADDAPTVLDALRRGDLDVDRAAQWRQPYTYLWLALYCEGRLTPATAPALRFLASAVRAPDFGGADPTLREGVVWFIREVARTVCVDTDIDRQRQLADARHDPDVLAWLDEYLKAPRPVWEWTDDEAPGRTLLSASLVDCFELLPEIFEAVQPLLGSAQPERLRRVTADATAMLARHPRIALP